MHALPDGKQLREIACTGKPAARVAGLSRDSRTLATLRQGIPVIDLWNFETGEYLGDLPG